MSGQPQTSTTRLTGDQARTRLITALPVTERRLELAGIPTAVLEGDAGDPVVLLHGQGKFAAAWAPVLPALAATHRVVAPDLPGHAASGVGDGALDAPRSVAWLRELIDRTCGAPPVLVGHLLGGAIALRCAIERDTGIRGLVLVDNLGLAPYRPAPGFALAMVGFVARPTERSRDRLFQRCFADYGAVRDQACAAPAHAPSRCPRHPPPRPGTHRRPHGFDPRAPRPAGPGADRRGRQRAGSGGLCTSSRTPPTARRSNSPTRSCAHCTPPSRPPEPDPKRRPRP